MTTTFVPQVAVVDFHHHRGPEVEFWADPAGEALCSANDWTHLPFLALPDGAHASSEEFSYFTLVSKALAGRPETSRFGVACTRQIRADRLKVKSADVTRSFVQKAIVIIVDKPGVLGQLRERLAAVTAAWFAQEDFSDAQIIKELQSSLEYDAISKKNEKETYFGLSLRELVYDLRYQTLVLLKCLLLHKRVLFFGTRCERLCMTQFALVSLIPHLLESLQDCASPELNTYETVVSRATNLKTSERSSLLNYMGLPLQIFGLDAFFSPYTPLQQLDFLSSPQSKSYIAGSTNTLFLSQRDVVDSTSSHRYSDVLVNLDEPTVSAKVIILDPALRSALNLSAADRRWVDHLTQSVLDTWNPADPSRPTTHGYQGSEDAIRLNFEEYILSLLSATAYKNHFDDHPNPYLSTTSGGVNDERYPNPSETASDFNVDFLVRWRTTPNYKLWHSLTAEAGIFDIVEPRHPTAGGLNIEDVQRRVGAAVAELNLDKRVRVGREHAGKAIEAGRERVGASVARFWKEVEGFKGRREQGRAGRELAVSKEKENEKPELYSEATVSHADMFDAGRKGAEVNPITKLSSTADINAIPPSGTSSTATTGGGWTAALRARTTQMQRPNVDTAQVQATAKENAAKAGAYISSWGSWASQKTREWQEARAKEMATVPAVPVEQVDISGRKVIPEQEVTTPGVQRQSTVGALAAAKSAMGTQTAKEDAK